MANLEEQLRHVNELKDKYLQSLSLLDVKLPVDSEKYLNLSQQDLQQISADDITIAAIVLQQSVLFIQQNINAHQTNYNWCQRYLNYIVAQHLDQVGGQYTPFEMKKNLVIKTNDVAGQLNKIMSEIQILLDTMKDIPLHIKTVANSYEKLAYCKQQK
jgi:hypothetical protein